MIIDSNGLDSLIELKEAIDDVTIKSVKDKQTIKLDRYCPWISLLATEYHVENISPVFQHKYSKGSLLTDLNKLIQLDEFLSNEGSSIWEKSESKTGIPSSRYKRLSIMRDFPKEMGSFYDDSLASLSRFSSVGRLYDQITDVLIPVADPEYNTYSYSSILARGAIFAAVPMNKTFGNLQFQISLIHELGHQTLYLVQCTDTLLRVCL